MYESPAMSELLAHQQITDRSTRPPYHPTPSRPIRRRRVADSLRRLADRLDG